jgi:hypothetical protein
VKRTRCTQFMVILCTYALLAAALPAQDLQARRADESDAAGFLSEPAVPMLLASAETLPASELRPGEPLRLWLEQPTSDPELTPELRELFKVESVRSEEFIARLSAAGTTPTPTLAAPAPAPQASGSDRKVAGWVKALIIIGGTGAGVAIFRAVIGADEDLAPFTGQ